MAKEIERKFLVQGDAWRNVAAPTFYRQGYLSAAKERIVRVRVAGDRGYLTVKGIAQGISRVEFEYEIPPEDAHAMLDLCRLPLIEKDRYRVPYRGLTWEIDEFHLENEGLVLAEVDLDDENRKIELPDWVGREVSGDPKYFNSNLIQYPYNRWPKG